MKNLTVYSVFLPVLIVAYIVSLSLAGQTFQVVQQDGDWDYISIDAHTVTQFEMAKSLAFLAHSAGAGRYFAKLKVGDVVTVGADEYQVARSDRYQVDGMDYIDLASGAIYSTVDLWEMYYAHPGHVILQTCLTVNGKPEGGRLFVVAERKEGN